MSTEQPPAAPAATSTPAPAGEEWKSMTGEQFKARLDETRQAGLKEALKLAGVKDVDGLKNVVEQHRQLTEAQKSEQQKLQEAAAQAATFKQQAEAYSKTLARTAARELAALPEAARKAITDSVGEDAHAQLERIEFLRASGLLATTTTAPKPATTAAAAGPQPIKPAAAGNAFETWQAIKQSNPQAAAHYYAANRLSIEAARPKSE